MALNILKYRKLKTQAEQGIAVVDNEAGLTDVERIIDRDSIHDILPFSWEQYPTYVQSGENFIRVLAVVDYPEKAYGNWLSELKRRKSNINVVQYLESSSSTTMIDYYRKTISNKEAELIKTFDVVKQKTLRKQIDSANLQLDKYLDNTTTFIYQYTYIYLRADSLMELDELTESVKNTLVKLQLKTITPVKATFQAFWSAMPIGENLLKEYTYKESNTEAASSMFPFDDGEILTLNGYFARMVHAPAESGPLKRQKWSGITRGWSTD